MRLTAVEKSAERFPRRAIESFSIRSSVPLPVFASFVKSSFSYFTFIVDSLIRCRAKLKNHVVLKLSFRVCRCRSIVSLSLSLSPNARALVHCKPSIRGSSTLSESARAARSRASACFIQNVCIHLHIRSRRHREKWRRKLDGAATACGRLVLLSRARVRRDRRDREHRPPRISGKRVRSYISTSQPGEIRPASGAKNAEG